MGGDWSSDVCSSDLNGPPSKLTPEIIHDIYGAKHGELIVDEEEIILDPNVVVA